MVRILKKYLGRLFTVGCIPPFNSSESRITIFTNVMAYWGFLVTIPILSSLQLHGISASHFLGPYSVVLAITTSILVFNYLKFYTLSRLSGWFVLNFLGWQAVAIYGKSFNGYLIFIPALAYGIISLSKMPKLARAFLAIVPLIGMLSADYLTHRQIFPITGLHSSQFHVAVLWIDSIVIFGFMAILLFVEKSFYDKYEADLQNLNENLESIVEKRTEMLVKAKEEAVQASLLKSQFVANTSHELRTPVQGLVGFIAMTKRRLEKMMPVTPESQDLLAKAIHSIDSADQSSQRLLNLIDRLLQITRTEAEGFTPRPTRFQLAPGLREVIREVENRAREKNIKISAPIDNVDLKVNTDKTLVLQVFENLITNAIRYGTSGTDVIVSVAEVEEDVVIRVTNHGVGVDASDIERIFEPFVQGKRTDSTIGGTGLGLSLCRKYAAALHGKVFLEDPSAERTVFGFSFKKEF